MKKYSREAIFFMFSLFPVSLLAILLPGEANKEIDIVKPILGTFAQNMESRGGFSSGNLTVYTVPPSVNFKKKEQASVHGFKPVKDRSPFSLMVFFISSLALLLVFIYTYMGRALKLKKPIKITLELKILIFRGKKRLKQSFRHRKKGKPKDRK